MSDLQLYSMQTVHYFDGDGILNSSDKSFMQVHDDTSSVCLKTDGVSAIWTDRGSSSHHWGTRSSEGINARHPCTLRDDGSVELC